MMYTSIVVLAVSVCSVLCQEDRPVPVVNMADQGINNEQAEFQSFLDDGVQNGFDNNEWNSIHEVQPVLAQGFAAAESARRPGNGDTLACGFSCSRRSVFNVYIDGTYSSVTCSDRNSDIRSRCDGCCVSRGLTAGIPENWSSGFLSNKGECICCHMNNQCGGNPWNPVPAAAAVPFGNK